MRGRQKTRRRQNRRLGCELLETRRLLAGDWIHNAVLPEDVDANAAVQPLDALLVINELLRGRSLYTQQAEGEPAGRSVFLDVNDDSLLTPADALEVINALAQGRHDDSVGRNDDGDSSRELPGDRRDGFEDRSDDEQGEQGDESDDSDSTTNVELKARLSGDSAARGKAEYEMETEHGVTKRELEVKLRDADANARYEVAIDGVVVGTLVTDGSGRGELKLKSGDDDDDDAVAFPADFPNITAGSAIRVGTVASGQFRTDRD